MATLDGVYYPDSGSVEADIPAEMLKVAQSLRGSTIRDYDSTSDRDTGLSSIPSALRRGAVVYTPTRGWQGYSTANETSGNYTASGLWSFDRVKGGTVSYTGAEGNGMYRVSSSLCFFDGQPPSAIIPFSTMADPRYYFAAGQPQSDGGGYLYKCINQVTGAQNTGASSLMFIAVR